MEYQSLIIAEESEMQKPEREFLELHREIMYCGNMAATYVVEMAKNLKQMRDEKLYGVANFKTFGEYVENAVGIKERQAYNYISIYENLPETFLQSNAKLGVSKLALLAPLSTAERSAIIDNTDMDSVSVRELKAQIEELRKTNEQMRIEFDDATQIASQKKLLEEEVANLEKELRQLKETTLEVKTIENPETMAELAKAQERTKALAREIEDLRNKNEQMQNTINDATKTASEVKTIENPETLAALTEAQERTKTLTIEAETLRKQLEIASDASMSKFKVKFEDLQRLGVEMLALLQSIAPEKAAKCRAGIKSVIAGWNL